MKRVIAMGICATILASVHVRAESDIGAAILATADYLAEQQVANGSWPGEEGHTGAMVAGLADAYIATGIASYETAAISGGNYILNSAGGNFYGDEAYALTRLSGISPDPENNFWRTSCSHFYLAVKHSQGGTVGYIDALVTGTDVSEAVFYLANHALAAHYVDAADKDMWRNKLIEALSLVDDNANFPVLALAASVWALVQTGPMDDTPIDIHANPDSSWKDKTLADLPDMLLGHMVTEGERAGEFYWRFDHRASGDPALPEVSGFTEDTAYGLQGLASAARSNPYWNYWAAIFQAREALANGVAPDGSVGEHLRAGGRSLNVFGGELLQAIAEPVIKWPLDGDANLDGRVNVLDMIFVRNKLGEDPTSGHNWQADVNEDGSINILDIIYVRIRLGT